MNAIKFKSGMVTLTRTDIERIKNDAKEAAIKELLSREQEIIDSLSEDTLYLVLLVGLKTLIDMDCEYDFVYEFADHVADVITSLNNEDVTMDSLEKEIDDFGIKLKKEE